MSASTPIPPPRHLKYYLLADLYLPLLRALALALGPRDPAPTQDGGGMSQTLLFVRPRDLRLSLLIPCSHAPRPRVSVSRVMRPSLFPESPTL